MDDLAAYILRTEHILLMAAVAAVIEAVGRALPGLADNPYWVRLLPVLPMLACSVAVWVPGLVDGSVGERMVLGVLLGSFCGHFHKVVRQTVLGNDKRIRDHPKRL